MLGRIKRILKHHWFDESATRRTMPSDMLARLGQRVTASEQLHSGQIRIYIETSLPLSYLWRKATMHQLARQRALALFGKLRVWDTAHNNGVLIYLLLAERAIELVADRGLNEKVAPPVWHALVASMSGAFKRGTFEDGLTKALEQVTTLLVQHFPLAAGEASPNELPNAPVLG